MNYEIDFENIPRFGVNTLGKMGIRMLVEAVPGTQYSYKVVAVRSLSGKKYIKERSLMWLLQRSEHHESEILIPLVI